MKALIDPRASVSHIVDWTGDPIKPVFETYLNSARVCEVQETDFPVADPLFWVDCADDVVADQFYYDTQQSAIFAVVNAPMP